MTTTWKITISYPFFVWTTWNLAIQLHGRVIACLFADLDCYTTALLDIPLHIILTLVLAPVVDLIQTLTFLVTLVRPTRNFTVIKKR